MAGEGLRRTGTVGTVWIGTQQVGEILRPEPVPVRMRDVEGYHGTTQLIGREMGARITASMRSFAEQMRELGERLAETTRRAEAIARRFAEAEQSEEERDPVWERRVTRAFYRSLRNEPPGMPRPAARRRREHGRPR
jgi:hypothetical protein